MQTVQNVRNQPLPCPHCGYDLRGQTEHRCPECGEEFNPRTVRSMTPPMSLRGIMICVFGPPIVVTGCTAVLALLFNLVGAFRPVFAVLAMILMILGVLFGLLGSLAVGTEFGMRFRKRMFGPTYEPTSLDILIGLGTVAFGLAVFAFQAILTLAALVLFDFTTAIMG